MEEASGKDDINFSGQVLSPAPVTGGGTSIDLAPLLHLLSIKTSPPGSILANGGFFFPPKLAPM